MIKKKLQVRSSTIRGVYEFMIDEKLYDGTYSNFRKYVEKHKLKENQNTQGHPRFETTPGIQAQQIGRKI